MLHPLLSRDLAREIQQDRLLEAQRRRDHYHPPPPATLREVLFPRRPQRKVGLVRRFRQRRLPAT